MNPIQFYTGNVTQLAENEVFTFGANTQGFHGAGSAGYASFNVPGNRWREFNYGSKPYGWKGCWNEKGKIGPMTGTKGKSYGLVTVTNAGAKRSLSPETMISNIVEFYSKAESRPEFRFLVAQSAQTGLNGFTGEEMAGFFAASVIPPNVVFQKEFAELIARNTKSELEEYHRA